MDWFLYNRDLRHERIKMLSTYTKSLFLHVVKHNFFLFVFFFYLVFLLLIFTIHRTAGEEGGYLLKSFLPFLPASLLCSSPLHIVGSWNRTWNLRYTLYRIHPFFTFTGRKMLKTRVALGNISRVLLNLTKRIFVIFKDSSSFSVFT